MAHGIASSLAEDERFGTYAGQALDPCLLESSGPLAFTIAIDRAFTSKDALPITVRGEFAMEYALSTEQFVPDAARITAAIAPFVDHEEENGIAVLAFPGLAIASHGSDGFESIRSVAFVLSTTGRDPEHETFELSIGVLRFALPAGCLEATVKPGKFRFAASKDAKGLRTVDVAIESGNRVTLPSA